MAPISAGPIEKDVKYWVGHLKGAPASIELPTDHRRPAEQKFKPAKVPVQFTARETHALRSLAARVGTSFSVSLLAAWQALMHRYARQSTVVTATSLDAPTGSDITPSPVDPANMVALRTDFVEGITVAELLAQLETTVRDAQSHLGAPLEKIIEALELSPDPSRASLVQTFVELSSRAPEQGGATLAHRPKAERTPQAAFDLRLDLREDGGIVEGALTYDQTLFDPAHIERMVGHLRFLMGAMCADPATPVGALPLVTEVERHQILVQWNATSREFGGQAKLHKLVEATAAQTPGACALEFEGRELTYAELNARANRLARVLRAKGVRADVLVGVFTERSFEMVVALLAVLKAGGAYVPLDPSYPAERLRQMMEDAQAPLILTQPHLAPQLRATSGEILLLDPSWAAYAGEATGDLDDEGSPQDLAYTIFTSGSTGRPKGAMNEHRAICNRLLWMQEEYQLTRSDCVLQKTPFSFDVSVWEFFWPLITGARLVIARPEGHRDPAYLADVIRTRGITTLHFVPSMLQVFLDQDGLDRCTSLRRVICSGEALPHDLQERFFARLPGVELHNLYGPTEAAVDVTYWACRPGDDRLTVPIGRPVANTQIYLLDTNLEPVPVGHSGELYIGGVQVGRGYVGRDDLTVERFVPDPFSRTPGNRLYRTGDLARHGSDGAIEYLGRLDHQVKIRGQRIELGEIEASLDKHARITQSVVMAREDTPGNQRLVAYLLTRRPTPSTEELKEHLAQLLPPYMVPSAFVFMEELPLTSSGKVDRKGLPPPTAERDARAYEPPVGATEIALANIWAEVLGVEPIGRIDNFFELGGHSLLAMSVISRMSRAGLHADVSMLLIAPTVSALATGLTANSRSVEIPPSRIPEGCQAIDPDMLPLVVLKPEDIARIVDQVPGGAANIQDIYPLAPLQEGLLFHHQLTNQGDAYLLSTVLRFGSRGQLDKYLEALQGAITRHDILRTAVLWDGLPAPVQVVCRQARLLSEEVSLADAGDVGLHLLERYNLKHYRLDVRKAPMLRVFFAEDTTNPGWVLLQVIHHLSTDHTSMELLYEEIESGFGPGSRTLPAPVPFRNLVAQSRLGVSPAEHEAFFRDMLGDVEEPSAPFDLTDVQGDGSGLAEAREGVDPSLGRRLRAEAKGRGVSVASICHLAWAKVLAALCGREDVVFGTVMLGRMSGRDDAGRVMGPCMNTLPIRIRVGEGSVEASLQRVQISLAHLLHHEHASLASAQRVSRVGAPMPLFTSMLNYRHNTSPTGLPEALARLADVGVEVLKSEVERTNYPIMLAVDDDLGGGFSLTAQTVARVNPERICSYMSAALEQLVVALEGAPTAPLRSLAVLPEAERHQLLIEWTNTKADFPQEAVLHQGFEAQAMRTPDRTALRFGTDAVEYRELNARSNRLAHAVRAHGIGRGQRVGLCLERGVEMLVAVLGILKAGAAYLPLDPLFPPERLRFMAEDAQVALLVSTSPLANALGVPRDRQLLLDADAAIIASQTDHRLRPDPARDARAEDPAYLIYTSGSTGQPKGVVVPHRAVVNFLTSMAREPGLTDDDVLVAVTTLSFDIAVLELMLPLTLGGTVVMASRDEAVDGHALRNLLERAHATVMQATPVTWRLLLEARWKGGKGFKALVGGEALPRDLADALIAREIELWNMYGPTETTVWSTCARIADTASGITIGKPIANTTAYILDAQNNLCPIGVPGELCIGGEGVTSGYWNRAELTAERFIPNPFNTAPGARLYRTGDRARWRNDGTIEHLGRLDFQVKVRGYRIELGEIEASIARHEGVKEVVVIVREDVPGDPRLVAYLVVEGPTAELVEQLRAQLRTGLPEYMVPSAFVVLDKLPLTPNAKIDRKALPAPEHSAVAGPRAITPPRTRAEREVARIWSEVLGLKEVGVEESFFELGGHSLTAMQVTSRLQHLCHIDVPLRDFFAAPTVAALALRVDPRSSAALGTSEDARARADDGQPIPRTGRGVPIPLSFSQRRMWLVQHLNAETTAYNVSYAVRLRGSLDPAHLRQAFALVLRRHEAFRTRFELVDGEPVQRVDAHAPMDLPVIDLRSLPPEQGEAEARRLMTDMESRTFDLSTSELHRPALVRMDETEHVFLWVLHHIIVDLWSLGILMREIGTVYAALLQGQQPALPPLPIGYPDFAAWQRQGRHQAAITSQVEARKRRLNALPPLLLPGDLPTKGLSRGRGGSLSVFLDPSALDRINRFSNQQGVTPFMFLLTCFKLLLARYSGQTDFAVGAPIAGRTRVDLEDLVGTFVNTLVIRTDLSGDPPFTELLARVKEAALDAFHHQEAPFERLVEELHFDRTSARSPLVQVLFNVENASFDPAPMPGLTLAPFEFDSSTSQFDLVLSIDTAVFREVRLFYDSDVFVRATAERMLANYVGLVEETLKDASRRTHEYTFLAPAETSRLAGWSGADRAYPRHLNVVQLLGESMDTHMARRAILSASGSISFGELQARSNRLARVLRARGVGRGSLVGLRLERSCDMIAAQIGVLKAGAAYVPLDPAYPTERLAYMAEDSKLALIITDSTLAPSLDWPAERSLLLDTDADAIAGLSDSPLEPDLGRDARPEDPAYVIYTSGSTGKPKGVAVPHRAVVNFLVSMASEPGLRPSDLLVAVTTLSFDIAVLELLLPLYVGAEIVLATRDETLDGVALRRLVEANHATVMQATPSTWRMLVEAGWPGNPSFKALVGGEGLPPDLARQLLSRTGELWNMYGPTETTVWSTCWKVSEPERGVSIGRPISNTQIHILDEKARRCPIGAPGEIYIGGDGVTLGYLNRAELTAERFVPDPFRALSGARMYRTGDRGRWRHDGLLEHLGRLDFQVKVRGYRIELGEIEMRLASHPEVAQAVVIAREDTPGDVRLVAYFVPRETEPATTALRDHLRSGLPVYMVPSHIVALTSIPLLPNGKINRRALPVPSRDEDGAGLSEASDPKTETEKVIARVWKEVLTIPRVGLDDNFFDIGGHSLLVMKALFLTERELGKRVAPTRYIFETLGQIARSYDETKPEAEPNRKLSLLRRLAALLFRPRRETPPN